MEEGNASIKSPTSNAVPGGLHPLPRDFSARLHALEHLWWVVAVDAYRSIAAMVEEGWRPDDAADAYGTWLARGVAQAVEDGWEWWQQLAGDAA